MRFRTELRLREFSEKLTAIPTAMMAVKHNPLIVCSHREALFPLIFPQVAAFRTKGLGVALAHRSKRDAVAVQDVAGVAHQLMDPTVIPAAP